MKDRKRKWDCWANKQYTTDWNTYLSLGYTVIKKLNNKQQKVRNRKRYKQTFATLVKWMWMKICSWRWFNNKNFGKKKFLLRLMLCEVNMNTIFWRIHSLRLNHLDMWNVKYCWRCRMKTVDRKARRNCYLRVNKTRARNSIYILHRKFSTNKNDEYMVEIVTIWI